jgi:hypothetical protein
MRLVKHGSSTFQVLKPLCKRLHFDINGSQCRGVALLTQFDGRSPFVELGQQSRFDLLKPLLDPLLIFVS